jgi:hypothetical protein
MWKLVCRQGLPLFGPLFRDQPIGHDHILVCLLFFRIHSLSSKKQLRMSMTVVAVFILRGFPPYIVGRCKFPVGERVKVRQSVFYVKVKGPRINRHMPECDELLRPLLRLQWIKPYLEIENRGLCLEVFEPLFIFTHMTTEAVLVGHGVAHLATHLVPMNPVVFRVG